ncbi:MAG: NAD(P)/FAD-dependent oxidoreductase [Pseudomonadota bacterium]
MPIEHLDTLIVGAGLSGIGAAVQLQTSCPGRSFAILEGREAMGGTWDLFRYPGIRSDSDMYTLGYGFRPWIEKKSIADGATILQYINDTAREHDIERRIRYAHRVKRASWSTADARWTLEIDRGPATQALQLSCSFLYICSGYYNYEQGYTPDFPGTERFAGRIVHPQKWTADIDYAGKRVVVIGSGATAVTLVPSMADSAAHVTMLQRSPTYVLSRPAEDRFANWLNRYLPGKLAYGITRWKNVLMGSLFYKLSKSRPERVRKLIIDAVRRSVGPNCDVDKHFTPSYKPWDQRLCLVPNSDLFRAIRKGRASVVTDHIEAFTEKGIRLRSGLELEADVVVTATGLDLLALGGIAITVDGKALVMNKTMSYKGMMLDGVPNLAYVVGYTNASWTLKADLTGDYTCRLLNFMDSRGYRQCTPVLADPEVKEESWIDFTSGYIQRSIEKFPAQGNKKPWRLDQNYPLDLMTLRYGKVDDGTMVFSKGA